MKTKQQKQALSLTAVGRLQMSGCTVVAINDNQPTPVIDIEKPKFDMRNKTTLKLRSKATRITQVHRGVDSKICVAQFNGCLVRWVDDELPLIAEICQTLNPYSPELISVWPRNF
ncbi:hypothetical protein [Shewanella sp. MSW]|uniref:hypothetical protein n=1 Tax=Shewanella sp. MSW TaxID=2569536 RepID=UPI001185EAC1|nr:hypothetical protein [Shewanella sp. MSW]TVP12504.1 hypothetical protein AYI96_05610 [Shewanella sp. MSW]